MKDIRDMTITERYGMAVVSGPPRLFIGQEFDTRDADTLLNFKALGRGLAKRKEKEILDLLDELGDFDE